MHLRRLDVSEPVALWPHMWQIATTHNDASLLFEAGRILGRPGRYLQVTLRDIDPARLHGLPDRTALMHRVSRELQVRLPAAAFEDRLQIEIDGRSLTASAEVVARLGLVDEAPNARERERLREVTGAGDRGLLDGDGTRRASFRVVNRARLRALEARSNAGYIAPEELIFDAVFARWHDPSAGSWETAPLGGDDLSRIRFAFEPAGIRRDFRVADLFSATDKDQ